jgi:hypothetical protein
MIRELICAAAGIGLIGAAGGCNFSAGTGNDNVETAAASPTRRFVNSPEYARSTNLRDHYVDFAFAYPSNWSASPQAIDGSAQNYVRVAAPLINGYEPFAFHVGSAWGTGNAGRDRAAMAAGVRDLAERFGAHFQDYRIVAAGPARVGNYDSYGWRFTASVPGVRNEPRVQVLGRGDIILPPGAARGVTLITLATSRNREVRRAEDVGEGGTLKALLDSFRLTGVEGNATAPSPAVGPAPAAPTAREAAPKQAAATPPRQLPAQPAVPAPPPAPARPSQNEVRPPPAPAEAPSGNAQ